MKKLVLSVSLSLIFILSFTKDSFAKNKWIDYLEYGKVAVSTGIWMYDLYNSYYAEKQLTKFYYTVQIAAKETRIEAEQIKQNFNYSIIREKMVNGKHYYAVIIGLLETKKEAEELRNILIEKYNAPEGTFVQDAYKYL